MVKVFKNTDDEFYMDGYLKDNLETAKRVVTEDWDMLFVTDGYEGSGKSVFTQQAAKFCDPTFNIDRLVFTPKQFKEAVLSAKKYQAIVYDEGYGGLNAKIAMRWVNRSIVKMLTEIRQKNLFLFVVLPTFFDLVKYVALWRSRALFHVYSGKEFQRGYFAFYNIDRKKNLYVHGKKFYSYSKPKPNFVGRFVNHYTVDKEEYKKKKLESTTRDDDEFQTKMFQVAKQIRQSIVYNLSDSRLGLTKIQISKIMGLSYMTIHRYLKEQDIKEEIEANY